MQKLHWGVVIFVLIFNTGSQADLLNFIVPYNADLYFTYVSGSSAAATDFGLEIGDGTLQTYLYALNSPSQPPYGYEVFAGHFKEGTELTVFELSFWHNNYYIVFSDAENPASINAFTDVNNSLGMDGSVVEQTSIFTWVLHLDDAAPYLDDDDNDVVVEIRLKAKHPAHVPESGTGGMLMLGCLMLLLISVRERWS